MPLIETLTRRNVALHHAIFVPPDSNYMKVGSYAPAADLSWQQSIQGAWQSSNGPLRDLALRQRRITLPALPGMVVQDSALGAVLPNLQVMHLFIVDALLLMNSPPTFLSQDCCLQVTLEWLRRCVREVPNLRMQVLVTGSLYLVGDVLRNLGQHT